MAEVGARAARLLRDLGGVYRSLHYSDPLVRTMLGFHLVPLVACAQERRKAACTRASLMKFPLMTSVFAVVFRPLRELLALLQPLYLRTGVATLPYFDDDRAMVALWVVPNLVLTLVFLLVAALHRGGPLPDLLSGEGVPGQGPAGAPAEAPAAESAAESATESAVKPAVKPADDPARGDQPSQAPGEAAEE